MKPTLLRTLFSTVVVTILITASAQAEPFDTLKKGARTDTISVPEMQCGMCEMKIGKTLKKIDGVKAAEADSDADIVIVTYIPELVTLEQLEEAIARVGYDAGMSETTSEAQAKLPACCRPGAHE